MLTTHSNIRTIFKLFSDVGIDAYIVGGAVRDQLLNVEVHDVDFAVECPPNITLQLAIDKGVKFVETGLDHGTITLVEGGQSFEVTSFRKDIKTDGRHAETEFGGTIKDDAARRDFTINALYMDSEGVIIDPLGGLKDIDAKRLAFVGNAQARIKEDYLRILRYFRFLAHYDLHIDPAELVAIKELAAGLNRISGERVGHEMRKLLGGPFAYQALNSAQSTGVLERVAPDLDISKLQNWIAFETKHKLPVDWRVRLAASSDEIPQAKWRLSNDETNFMKRLQKAAMTKHAPAALGHILGYELAHWAALLRANSQNNAPPENLEHDITRGVAAVFPITGRDLKSIIPEGPELGAVYKTLKRKWLAMDFAADKDTLMELAIKTLNETDQ